MNEKDFASLMQGVKEMTAHMRGEDVPRVKVTSIPDPDVHAIREAVSVTQKELAALLGVSRRTSRELGTAAHPPHWASTGAAADLPARPEGGGKGFAGVVPLPT